MSKKTLKIGGSILILVLALVLCVFAYFHFSEKTQDGQKNIAVQIICQRENIDKTVNLKSDAEYLRGALEEENLVAGEESAYGLFVLAVDGIKADSSAQEWWCLTRDGGNEVTTGIDTTVIKDGDKFEFTLKQGW